MEIGVNCNAYFLWKNINDLKPFKLYFSFFLQFQLCFVSGNLFAQVAFIENKGQWDASVEYMSAAGDGSFFIQKNGYTITQFHPDDVQQITRGNHNMSDVAKIKSGGNNKSLRSHSYNVEFLNASEAVIIPEKPRDSKSTYKKLLSSLKIF